MKKTKESFLQEMGIVCKNVFKELKSTESYLISAMWQNSDLFAEIQINNKQNSPYKIYDKDWKILYDVGKYLALDCKMKNLMDFSKVPTLLHQNPEIEKQFKSLGEDPFTYIQNCIASVNSENIDAYYQDYKKWHSYYEYLRYIQKSFTIDAYNEMTKFDFENLYKKTEYNLNRIFVDIDENVKPVPLTAGIEENLLKWEHGEARGLDFIGFSGFSESIGGIPDGGITLIGGVSNAGKSSFLRCTVLPSLLKRYQEKKEKTVIFLNEEDVSKWQREMLVYIVNNDPDFARDRIQYKDGIEYIFAKSTLRNGNFLNTWNDVLQRAIKRLKELYEDDNNIVFLSLEKFCTDGVIKSIKKFAATGYKNFIIDTFKMDNTDDAKIDNMVRLKMVRNMTNLYNIAKPSVMNLRIICTVQLAKGYTMSRFLTQECLAESKNMIDVVSLAVFIRNLWEDEKDISIYKYSKQKKEEISDKLDTDKNYLILFPVKTREGAANLKQCIAEVNWATNTLNEIGWTQMNPNQ